MLVFSLLQELLLAVVRLALQDPRQVVEKSVETAVRNSGQIHMVVKVGGRFTQA